ncbi:ribonuclease P protein subunit p25-like protein [Arapaima gigas]
MWETDETSQATMEVSMVPDMFHPFQGKTYGAQPPAGCDVIGLHPPPALPSPKMLSSSPSKPRQSNFKRVCRMEEASPSPFPGLPEGVLEMRVKEGSKIRNLMGFAMVRMQGEGSEQSGLRQVVFAGSGRAITKTITCAEILKRRLGGLHQLTKVYYKTVHEVWEKREGGTPEVTVHRTIPAISILLSKDPLDPKEPGYQPPEAPMGLWGVAEPLEQRDDGVTPSKRGFGLLSDTEQPSSKKPCV